MPEGEAEECDPAGQREERERQADDRHGDELAPDACRRWVTVREPPPDPEVVAPGLGVRDGQEPRRERRAVRLRDELGQSAIDEEAKRAPRPDGLGGMWLPEQGAVVLADLVGVPRGGNQDRDSGDDRDNAEQRSAVPWPRHRRDYENQEHDANRPQRPGPDELSEAEHEPERHRHTEPVVRAYEEPRREDERRRREQHRQRLGMEHRRRLHYHRADGEEHDCREMEDLPPRPEQACESEQQD